MPAILKNKIRRAALTLVSTKKVWVERSMTMSKAGLAFFILLVVGALIDLGLLVFGRGETSTISNFLVNAGYASPLVTGGLFLAMGHLFTGMWPEDWNFHTVKTYRRIQFRSAFFGAIIFEGVRAIAVYALKLGGWWESIFFFLPS